MSEKLATQNEGDTPIEAPAPAGLPESMKVTQQKKRVTVADLAKAIEIMKLEDLPETLGWCGELDGRLAALEEGFLADAPAVAGDINNRITTLEACWKATNAIGDATRVVYETHTQQIDSLLEVVSELQNEIIYLSKPTETITPEFDTQPVPERAGVEAMLTYDTVANLCATIPDVLMLCKILNDDSAPPDKERFRILRIAGAKAGVEITAGMQFRAGVHNVIT